MAKMSLNAPAHIATGRRLLARFGSWDAVKANTILRTRHDRRSDGCLWGVLVAFIAIGAVAQILVAA